MKNNPRILPATLFKQAISGNPDIYINDSFGYVNHVSGSLIALVQQMVSTPQYVPVGRLVRITHGSGYFKVNMLPFDLQAGDVLIIPENSYIEINNLSVDFDVQFISFNNLPVSYSRATQMHLPDNDFQRVGKYFGLIWEVLHKPSFSMRTIEYLLSAVMNDLAHMHEQATAQQKRTLTHAEQQIRQFTDLVAMNGTSERNIAFYADQMHLTPNHLSALVRKQTGRSIMQWLNERTILQAKVLLRHTNRPISDIAFELNFTEATLFSRFFRRETGQTPKDYRSNK